MTVNEELVEEAKRAAYVVALETMVEQYADIVAELRRELQALQAENFGLKQMMLSLAA